MPPPKPDAARARALELAKKMGVRGVAAALKKEGYIVGKSAVAEWVRAARPRRGEAPQPHRAAPPARSASAPHVRKAAVSTARRRLGETEAVADEEPDDAADLTEGELQGLDPDALDFAELERVDAQVGRFMREAYRDRDERRYAVLARLKLEVRTAMQKIRPMPKVDPLVDPASLEARRAVLSRLGKMMENARAAVAARAVAAGEDHPPP